MPTPTRPTLTPLQALREVEKKVERALTIAWNDLRELRASERVCIALADDDDDRGMATVSSSVNGSQTRKLTA